MTNLGHTITVAEAYRRRAWRVVELKTNANGSRVTNIEHCGRNKYYFLLYTTTIPGGVKVRAEFNLCYEGEIEPVETKPKVLRKRVDPLDGEIGAVRDEYYADLALTYRNNWRKALRLPLLDRLEDDAPSRSATSSKS